MNLTLLLDLDDTLLVNDIESFLPHYLGAFAKEAAPYVEPDKFIKTLLAASQVMSHNQQPDCTLQEAFEAAFFPILGADTRQIREVANRFYSEVYPTLRRLTQPRAEAVQLVEQALARGYRLAVATNPLFPFTAVAQRLAWANLPVDAYLFDLVTSYETFHFAKPTPAYFAEVLARLGWPDGPVVVVGNDLERDILPARSLGLAAYWFVQEAAGQPTDGLPASVMRGGLADVLPQLAGVPPESLQPDYSSPSAMLAILRATPAVLDSLCRDLPEAIWKQRPEAAEWCLTEIMCHLRDVEQDVNLWRVQKLLQENNPFVPGKDTDRWAVERQYIQQDGRLALQQFTTARLKLLDALETLDEKSWQRSARHAIFGPTTLAELVGIVAGHDRLHVQQVHKALQAVKR